MHTKEVCNCTDVNLVGRMLLIVAHVNHSNSFYNIEAIGNIGNIYNLDTYACNVDIEVNNVLFPEISR